MVIFFMAGCTTTVYISSLTDPRYAPVKTDSIHILLRDEASIADRQFYSLLKDEMIRNGFNIVEVVNKAKYLLLFQTESETSRINSTLYLPLASTSSGYIGNKFYSGSTTSIQAIPYNYNYTVKKIYLELYMVKDVKNKKYMTVWEGYIGAGRDQYESFSRAILKSLLDVFGTNYKAHTPINKKYDK